MLAATESPHGGVLGDSLGWVRGATRERRRPSERLLTTVTLNKIVSMLTNTLPVRRSGRNHRPQKVPNPGTRSVTPKVFTGPMRRIRRKHGT